MAFKRRFRSRSRFRRRFRRRRLLRRPRRLVRFRRRRRMYRRRRRFRKSSAISKLLKNAVAKMPVYDVRRVSMFSYLGVNGWLHLPCLGDMNRDYNACRLLPSTRFYKEYKSDGTANPDQDKFNMMDCKNVKDTWRYKILNPNPGNVYCTAYYCYLRRDCSNTLITIDTSTGGINSSITAIWDSDMDMTNTNYNVLSSYFDLGAGTGTGTDYPGTNAGLKKVWDRLEFTPFMSTKFCQLIKIYKTKKFIIPAGSVKSLKLSNSAYKVDMDLDRWIANRESPESSSRSQLNQNLLKWPKYNGRFILVKFHGDYCAVTGDESNWGTVSNKIAASPAQLKVLCNRKTVYIGSESYRRRGVLWQSGGSNQMTAGGSGGYYHAGGTPNTDLQVVRPGKTQIQVTAPPPTTFVSGTGVTSGEQSHCTNINAAPT